MEAGENGRTRTIATFYSFKGGTGRTMALANVAFLLGRELKKTGQKVLAVDWDLEAPGLHRYFSVPETSEQTEADRPGLIDYFRDLKALLDRDASAYERLVEGTGAPLDELLPLTRYTRCEVADGLDLMTAGRFDSAYQERVAEFDWAAFHRSYHRLFRRIREQFTTSHSWCLIDSRTGLTDVSGVCTMLMPEKLVSVFTPNRQSVEGLVEAIEKAIAYRRESDDPRPLSVFPLPSRIITGELELSREARADYRARFERCLKKAYGVDAVDLKQYFDEVEIPHKDYYGFSERVAVRDDPTATDALSINQAYQRFYGRLVRDDAAWEMPVDYTAAPRVYISSTFADLEAHRAKARDAAVAAGLLPVMTEPFTASGERPALAECMARVGECDVLMVMVAHRYGWKPEGGGGKSITELECEEAARRGIEVLAFLVDERCDWPAALKETHRITMALEMRNATPELLAEVQGDFEKLDDFKKWLNDRGIPGTYSTPDSLHVLALVAFASWRERHPEFGAPAGTTPRTNPQEYLKYLREQTAWIDIRGLQVGTGKAHRFPIEVLYIPLAAAGGSPLSEINHTEAAPARPLEQMAANPRLVVVGDAGSGKSTFLRRLAFLLCKTQTNGTKGGIESRFPILIRMPQLAAHIQRELGRGRGSVATQTSPGWIPQFLAVESAEFNLGLDEEFFRRTLTEGRCTLLLDELDAVPTRVERESLARLVENASNAYPKCHVVVTTRPSSYVGEGVLSGFQVAQVEPLETPAITAFLDNWSTALFPEGGTASKLHSGQLTDAISSVPEIRRMARNPLMLTALAVVHWNERRLPGQRADLYESILNWLARSREKRPGRESSERCLTLLQQLALEMQRAPKGRQVQVEKGWAAETLASRFEGPTEAERRSRAIEFLEQEEVDSNIVVSRGAAVRFWHLTFQEYLAARAIGGLVEVDQRELLLTEDRIFRTEWREVVLLLAGVLGVRQGAAKVDGLFAAVLDRLSPKVSLAAKARCMGLLGAIVNDLGPLDYQPADPRYRELMHDVLGIFDREKAKGVKFAVRLEAAEALGQAGDPRIGRENWVRIEAGTFRMGEGQGRKVTLKAFEIGKYPVTVAEYRRFLEDDGYQDDQWWKAGGFGLRKEPDRWYAQKEHPNRPVTYVSWYEASAYCAWAGVRLPSEAEWERAAGGVAGRRYPWGKEEPDATRANYVETGPQHTTPVGLYPEGATPEGVVDLAGNVWEWVEDRYGKGEARVTRGGAFGNEAWALHGSYRGGTDPGFRLNVIGFRCVREVFVP